MSPSPKQTEEIMKKIKSQNLPDIYDKPFFWFNFRWEKKKITSIITIKSISFIIQSNVAEQDWLHPVQQVDNVYHHGG